MIFRSAGVNAWAREKGIMERLFHFYPHKTSSPFLSKHLVCNNETCNRGRQYNYRSNDGAFHATYSSTPIRGQSSNSGHSSHFGFRAVQ